MTENLCPICGTSAKIAPKLGDREKIHCPKCGEFTISGTALAIWISEQASEYQIALLSHCIRNKGMHEEKVVITSDFLQNVLKNSELPTPTEQVRNFLLWFGEQTKKNPGAIESIDLNAVVPVVGTKDVIGCRWIIRELEKKKLLEIESAWKICLTFDGWDKYHELLRTLPDSRTAFMAMDFNNPIIRTVYEHHFKPAVRAAGFELRTVDESQNTDLIDDQMRVRIRTSRFLIADLTHRNNGAYFEAGFAEGLGKPVIYTCDKNVFEGGKGVHFDVNHFPHVLWDQDRMEEAGGNLKAMIRETLPAEANLEDD